MSQEDPAEHGYTDRCPKCEDLRAGRPHTRAHDERCRATFVKLFRESEKDMMRLEAEERRMSASIARNTERYLRSMDGRRSDAGRAGASAERTRRRAQQAACQWFLDRCRRMIVKLEADPVCLQLCRAALTAAISVCDVAFAVAQVSMSVYSISYCVA